MRSWIKLTFGSNFKEYGKYSQWCELSNPLRIFSAMFIDAGNKKGWKKRFWKNILYSDISYIKKKPKIAKNLTPENELRWVAFVNYFVSTLEDFEKQGKISSDTSKPYPHEIYKDLYKKMIAYL